MTTICGNCGKQCTIVAERTACCLSPHVFSVITEEDSPLTPAQIVAVVSKLGVNGLRPGARVFDVTQAPYEDEDETNSH